MGFNTIWIKDDFSFEDLKRQCWSGAIDTLRTIEEHKKEDLFMTILEDMYMEYIPTLTEINDFLWFEDDDIFEMLEINVETEGNKNE